jgi:hypothetical protein
MKSMMVGMVAVVFGCLVGCAASEEPTSEPTTDEVMVSEEQGIHENLICYAKGTTCSVSTGCCSKVCAKTYLYPGGPFNGFRCQ